MASTFALTPMPEALVSIISVLGDNPNTDDGLTASQLKAKFDEGGKNIRTFLNGTTFEELKTEIRAIEDKKAGTADISDGAVTTAKLGSGAVTTAKLDSGAVTEAKIDTNAVTAGKIASGAVSTAFTGLTLAAASWTGEEAPYTYALTVTGLLAADMPVVDVVMSGTYETDAARDEEWAKIYRAVPSADTLTFYAKDKPLADLPVQILCVRK